MSEILLAADIGGTKTLLALVEEQAGVPRLPVIERYDNDAYSGFEPMLRAFVAAHASGRPVARACLGVAGPREGECIWLTNRPWLIDGPQLAAALGGAQVELLNDFEATAYGVEALQPEHLLCLQRGEAVPRAPQLVIGAGTGLGIAYRVWAEGRYRVVAGEGGHMGFAPADTQQNELWRALYPGLSRVSAEHVVSGAGLARIYTTLGGKPHVDPADISAAALERGDPLALQALNLFVSCFGAVAGDHALAVLARGGIFLAGGIAPKVLQPAQASNLLSAFNTKGGHSALVERMPVHVVLNEQVGLLGAAVAVARRP